MHPSKLLKGKNPFLRVETIFIVVWNKHEDFYKFKQNSEM